MEEVYLLKYASIFARLLGRGSTFVEQLDPQAFGLQLPENIFREPTVMGAALAVQSAGKNLEDAAIKLDEAVSIGSEFDRNAALLEIVEVLKQYVNALKNYTEVLNQQITAANFPDAQELAIAKNFVGQLVKLILDYFVINEIESYSPKLAIWLKIFGFIDWSQVASDPTNPLSVPYYKKRINLHTLNDFINNPAQHLVKSIGWGTPEFDPTSIFFFFEGFGDIENVVEVGIENGDPYLKKDVLKFKRDSSSQNPGLTISLEGAVEGQIAHQVPLSEKWGINLNNDIQFTGGLVAKISPPFDFSLAPNAGEAKGKLSVFFGRNPNAGPFNILGGLTGIGLTAEDISLGFGLDATADLIGGKIDANPVLFLDLKGLVVTIGTADADGFIAEILKDVSLEGRFDLGLEWRANEGLVVKASGGVEILIPIHKSLGPVNFDSLYVVLHIGENGELIPEFSTVIGVTLGPLKAVVERMGVTSSLEFSENSDSSFGLFDVNTGFKPPIGVGLSIDAGVVKGGGFVRFYPEKGEYSGFLELTFSEMLSLKAIGIINTKMPDGSDGFSMLVIIIAEFGSGIQLGFGFTLLGVGGLLGLNRTMKLDALATGVRTGAVNGVMFPTNIIENAPRIISDLQDFFPVQQDRFLIGPMAKLAWGTPALITISLGIIIEIPGNIAILGVLKIVLPTEEASLIKLQVNFIGAIEFDKERLWFFASMYDSRVLFYTLEGEMGLLVGWGAKANFVSSVGGFHPAFNPPALPFPNPVRISLSILNESWGKIRVMGYFAVTSNTAQFGAKAELYFKFSEFKIEGHISFDALFQFSPFYMVIQLSSSLSVKVFGVGLFSVRVKMSLEGPAPWYANGTGSISLLFFDLDVDFDFTWGEEKDTTLPPISIMPLLVTEFEKKENWKALVPKNNNLLVSLREIDSVAELVLNPVGTLQVSQRKIPLKLTLDKLGSQKPKDANFFSLDTQDSELSKIKILEEDFAIAQFKDLKDAEKLNSPSYQPIEGGMELSMSGDQLKTGKTVKRHIRYELITIDTNYKRGIPVLFKIIKSLFGVFLRGNTVSRAEVSFQTKKNLQPFDSQIKITDNGFSVAKISNNSILDAKAHFSSQAQAKEYMQAQLLVNPELDGELHVLPNNEINPAA